MGISGVLSYLEYALLHKIFVMGIFGRNLRSEQAMAEASDMSPISLTLNDYRVTLGDGHWSSDYPEDPICGRIDRGSGAMEKEVTRLRLEKRKLMRDLEKYKRQAREMDDLKERWSNLDFKYQLLMDMWTLRALDNEKQPSQPQSPKSKTPSRPGTPQGTVSVTSVTSKISKR